MIIESRISENWVPKIREIGSLQVHKGYLTFSLKKLVFVYCDCTMYSMVRCSVVRSLPSEKRNHVQSFGKLESGIHKVLNLNAMQESNTM